MTHETNSPPSQSANNRWRKRLAAIAPVVLSAILLYWVVGRAGLGEVWTSLTRMDPLLLLVATAIFSVGVVLRSLRWQILLRDVGVESSLLNLISIYTMGIFFDNLLPTGMGGDIVRALRLRRDSQRGAEAASSVVANRITGMVTMATIGALALFISPDIFPPIITWTLVLFLGGMLLAVWVIRQNALGWLAARVPFARPILQHPKLQSFNATAGAYSPRRALLAMFVSAVFVGTLIGTQYTVSLATGLDLSLRYFAISAPVAGAVTMLPISFNGLGVREGLYQILFTSAGVSASDAIAMSLAFYGIRFGVGLVGGLLFFLSSARNVVEGGESAPQPESSPSD